MSAAPVELLAVVPRIATPSATLGSAACEKVAGDVARWPALELGLIVRRKARPTTITSLSIRPTSFQFVPMRHLRRSRLAPGQTGAIPPGSPRSCRSPSRSLIAGCDRTSYHETLAWRRFPNFIRRLMFEDFLQN